MRFRENNRGITLIELVIAVAMLSILIVPITLQLVSSISSNARSRERQGITETSDYVLEFFQKTKKVDLDRMKSDDPEVQFEPTKPMEHKTVKVKMVKPDGSSAGSDPYVSYDLFSYYLKDKVLGKNKTEYERSATIDNLAVKIKATKHKVKYYKQNTIPTGWNLTADGMAVRYDGMGYISDIIVEDDTSGYVVPGTINQSTIQNLDANRMAIINGGTNTIDRKFASDVLGTCIKNITSKRSQFDDETFETLTNYYKDTDDGSDSTILNNKLKNILRSAKRYIEFTLENDDSDNSFNVTCKVYYDAVIEKIDNNKTGADYTVIVPQTRENYSYTVYTKKFITNEAPDVYYVYEPLVDSTIRADSYVMDDYIIVNADSKCAGYTLRELQDSCTTYNSASALATYAAARGFDEEFVNNIRDGFYYDGSLDVPKTKLDQLHAYLVIDGKLIDKNTYKLADLKLLSGMTSTDDASSNNLQNYIDTANAAKTDDAQKFVYSEANAAKVMAQLVLDGYCQYRTSGLYLIKPDMPSLYRSGAVKDNVYKYLNVSYKPTRIYINQELSASESSNVYGHMIDVYSNVGNGDDGLFDPDLEDQDSAFEADLGQFVRTSVPVADIENAGIGATGTEFKDYMKNKIHPMASQSIGNMYTVTVTIKEKGATNGYVYIGGKGAY